jgi:hypothetical protein
VLTPPCREEATRLLQVHERARQGRLRAKLMRDIRKTERKEEKKEAPPNGEGGLGAIRAAVGGGGRRGVAHSL